MYYNIFIILYLFFVVLVYGTCSGYIVNQLITLASMTETWTRKESVVISRLPLISSGGGGRLSVGFGSLPCTREG